MIIWFLSDPVRLANERKAIDDLQKAAEWLKGASWSLEGAALRLDADIEAHDYVYPVKMVYPAIFPVNPPTIWPREGKEHWSGHQYGPGGELCLEWGPDTWHPDVTGAEMLVSAFKLLSTENPKGEGPQDTVPSRHRSTLGQELRGNRFAFRFLVTASLRRHLMHMPPGASGGLKVILLMRDTGIVRVLVRDVFLDGQETWTDPSLPPRLSTYGRTCEGHVLATPLASSDLRVETLEELELVLRTRGLLPQPLAQAIAAAETVQLILLRDREGGLHPFLLPPPLLEMPVIPLGDDQPWRRIGPVGEALQGKRVGVVGLGSAGSKIAVALARSEVSRFVLVDDDVLLPENLVRHTLDWRDVGEHKVVGLREQLRLISPASEVEIWPFQLAGQEATAATAGALKSLSECDLIVDATAEPQVFNQLATLVKSFPRSLVWLEIYAGGMGGMIARSRPGKDPSPLQIRARFHGFLADCEAPPVTTLAPYTTQGETGEPLIATDADVAAIADHAARLVLDSLLAREPSTFPYPLYLIGLARGWVFEQPFHTIPIDAGPPMEEQQAEVDPEVAAEGIQFLQSLLDKVEHGD
jgi:ThiF family protein